MPRYASYKKIGRIGYITLHRPELDLLAIKDLNDCFKRSIEKRDICVVFTSSKENFAVGEDLKQAYEIITNPAMLSKAHEAVSNFQELTSLMREHSGIIITGYRGWVIGGGFELTLFSDFRIAATNTKIWLPELDIGMFFSNASTKALAWLIGASKAKELMLLGEVIDVKKALEYGIVNKICEPNELEKACRKMARKIAQKSPIALTLAKKLINAGPDITFDEALYREMRAIISCGKSEEARMRIKAFLNKTEEKN
ncbi:MAG: enoyl-CoA hydratase/isomerase family protein [Promethearchaeota archaeon]